MSHPLRRVFSCGCVFWLGPALLAQAAADIEVARIRELVSWIASDERGGRDSPSPGLEATARWLEERLQGAGLEPGVQGKWRHRYELPGQQLDSRALVLTVELGEGEHKVRKELQGDVDVRLLRPAEAAAGSDANATFVPADDPRLDRMLGMGGGRRAAVLVVAEAHPFWQQAAGVRTVVSRRLRGSAPVFLVRQGALSVPPREPATNETAAANETPVPCALTWQGAGAATMPVELANVVGVLRGEHKPDEYVLVSAHYDHIGISAPVDGDAINNGADDDATGTAAVVALAEALVKRPRPARSIAFVCFSAEEKGLRGSRAFCEQAPLPLESIVANVNIEMIGRPETGKERAAWITGRDYSDFAAIAAVALQRAGIELVDHPMAASLFAQSDNFSLVRHGVVAHSISAGSLHADYHRPSDEVERLDLEHMTAVVRGLAEVVTEFANRPERPQWSAAGRTALERLRDR